MKVTTDFQIEGQPMILPDAGVGFSFEDLDDSSSGRDEAGVMHRFVARYDVGKWAFTFSNITEAEKNYLESLFPKTPTFQFTHPSAEDSDVLVTDTCYRSKRDMSWYNARTGVWKNYKFNIIQC